MELNNIYFYTATIKDWKPVLSKDSYKEVLIESLMFLIQNGKLIVYGFVIMPNHFHIIWEMLALNGKELPHTSFMKFTSHMIFNDIKKANPKLLLDFKVRSVSRSHNIWMRHSLPIHLYSDKFIHQKLTYIHNNPLQEHWRLAERPEDYKYSSARFYETGIDEFGILTHIGERI
ncbi:MAG: transposase [Imperialibacter sp.]|uniref:transposase n=1 Tax=Imperialibacter sp. TaxID=2038411 RepID=UPI0032EB6052